MKTKIITAPAVPSFTDDDIRAYAEHLYEQSGRIPGRDLDNWLEAKACLEANIPRNESHRRLQHHITAGRTLEGAGGTTLAGVAH